MKTTAAFLALLCAAPAAWAQEKQEKKEKQDGEQKAPPMVLVEKLKGDADVKRPSGKDWEPAKEGMKLEEGSQVSTGFDTEMVLKFEGDHRITLKSLTQIEVSKLLRSDTAVQTSIRLDIGTLKGKVEKEEVPVRFEVRNPVVTASVKGTEWTLGYSSDFGFSVRVVEGLLSLNTPEVRNLGVAGGGSASTPATSAFHPGGSVSRGVMRGFEQRASDRTVAMHDVASQADLRASLAGMVPQYAEFSLNDPGVSTSVMSLRQLLNSSAQFQIPPGGAVFSLCPLR
jgi:hypothetical protein